VPKRLHMGPPNPPKASRSYEFIANRGRSFSDTLAANSNEEKMRAALAVILVSVLIALQFVTPHGPKTLTTAAQTLAISVVAFYFGLHSANTGPGRRTGGSAAGTPRAPESGAASAPARRKAAE
jgi:hypothetical protein